MLDFSKLFNSLLRPTLFNYFSHNSIMSFLTNPKNIILLSTSFALCRNFVSWSSFFLSNTFHYLIKPTSKFLVNATVYTSCKSVEFTLKTGQTALLHPKTSLVLLSSAAVIGTLGYASYKIIQDYSLSSQAHDHFYVTSYYSPLKYLKECQSSFSNKFPFNIIPSSSSVKTTTPTSRDLIEFSTNPFDDEYASKNLINDSTTNLTSLNPISTENTDSFKSQDTDSFDYISTSSFNNSSNLTTINSTSFDTTSSNLLNTPTLKPLKTEEGAGVFGDSDNIYDDSTNNPFNDYIEKTSDSDIINNYLVSETSSESEFSDNSTTQTTTTNNIFSALYDWIGLHPYICLTLFTVTIITLGFIFYSYHKSDPLELPVDSMETEINKSILETIFETTNPVIFSKTGLKFINLFNDSF